MNLGSGFPDDFRLAQIRRRLKPGVVIELFRRMDDGRLHEKRFVVLHVDAHTTTCVINRKSASSSEPGPRCCAAKLSFKPRGTISWITTRISTVRGFARF